MRKSQLDAFWMPYTANRHFKADPRMIVGAEGAYYLTEDGRTVFDGLSGLWTTGAGHCRSEISTAVACQLNALDYSPAFQFGHPLAFSLADRLADMAPDNLNHVFSQIQVQSALIRRQRLPGPIGVRLVLLRKQK